MKTNRGGKMNQPSMNLYENGIDFIERSMESYLEAKEDHKEYKYAVMFLGIGAELILKSILESVHPLFVLESLDGEEDKTIPSNKIISRLKRVFEQQGRKLREPDVRNLESIRAVRNSILHKNVHFTEEPVHIFTRTLYSLDNMVKLFSEDRMPLASTLENWKFIVDDEKIREEYHNRIRGYKIGNFTIPCSVCLLETIVPIKDSDSFICKHCQSVYVDVFQLLDRIDTELDFKDDVIVIYIEELLEKEKTEFEKVIKAINAINSYSLKNITINKIIDYLERNNITVHSCPNCGELDFFFYDKGFKKCLCIKCGELELEECEKCLNKSLVSSYEGYEYCYICEENPTGQCCNLCDSEDFSYLFTMVIDVKKKLDFERLYKYNLNKPPFMEVKCCPYCQNDLYNLENEGIIELVNS